MCEVAHVDFSVDGGMFASSGTSTFKVGPFGVSSVGGATPLLQTKFFGVADSSAFLHVCWAVLLKIAC